MLNDFISLLFPHACLSCGSGLIKNESDICMNCVYHLPKTNFHLHRDNPISKMFWGRIPFNAAAAFYRFNKGGKVQNLIHQLKYKGQKNLGFTIGKLYGNDLKNNVDFLSVNLVIPVPLHPEKQKKRGYNQSDSFAKGLAESLNAEAIYCNLIRTIDSESQTKKSRFKRWENVATIFQITQPNKIEGKHILLVDDVITTGATLEACARTILKINNVKISIATIAYAAN